MAKSNNIKQEKSPTTIAAARIGWIVLILATLYVCYFSHLGAIGFVGPDEPRYAWIARDMAETGDWITPRLYGKPWFEKPVLYYWGAALSFKLFGVSEAAARLPSAVSALLATLALAWLALRVYGAETARWLLLLLPTTAGMIGFSHAASTDMPFSGMLTIAMVGAAVILGLTRNENTPFLPRTQWLALILFGVFLGLAVLAKGPAALILSGGTIFFWALFTKRWREAFRLFHPAALASFCLTALPWYVLCARRNPDFLRIFIIEHNFRRYLTPEFQHVQPFWYYVPTILIAFLPWTAALLWSLVSGLFHSLRGKTISFRSVFFLAWAVFCVTFFTLSKSKLPGYVLPAVPAVGLLMARCCASLATQHRKSFGVTLFGFGCVLMGLITLTDTLHLYFNMAGTLMIDIIPFVVLLIALTNVMMGSGFSFAQDVALRRALTSLSVIPVLLALAFVWRLSPESLLDQLSARGLASEIVLRQVPVRKIQIYAGVQRGKRYALDFYLRTELKDWDQNPINDAYVLSGAYRCSHLQSKGFKCTEVNLGIHALGWYLSRIAPNDSADRLPHGGEPQ